jgi:PAS domain-containing protein
LARAETPEVIQNRVINRKALHAQQARANLDPALTGRDRKELIGSPFKDYFTDPDRANEGIKQVPHEGKVTNYELTARSKDGQERSSVIRRLYSTTPRANYRRICRRTRYPGAEETPTAAPRTKL